MFRICRNCSRLIKLSVLRSVSVPPSIHVHRNLVKWSSLASVFNNRPSSKFNINLARQNVGLFEIPEIQDWTGLHILNEKAENEADSLVAEAVSTNRSRKMVQIFDELSNCICRVADMSDFIQVAHPDQRYREAAEQTCVNLARLVEKLNTNTSLYHALKTVIDDGDKVDTDDIDKRVADLFMFDFQQSGIHLEDDKRKSFIALNESALMLGTYFSQSAHAPASVPASLLPESIAQSFVMHGDAVMISGLFSDHPNPLVREAAYRMYLHPDAHRIDLLESLLERRHQIAQLVGFPTYAHRALRGTLADSPENVSEFLEALSAEILPRAQADYKHMLSIRDRHLTTGQGDHIHPWDPPYLAALGRQERYNVHTLDIMAYLSLGCCMEGLSHLLRHLYGTSLQRVECEEGELWHSDVYKLAVIDEDSGVLGYIFCDFFERADKANQDCHFTIHGGRETADGSYQLPRVVLFLNFPAPSGGVPSLLTPGMLENLFHEFGHAMHSMLGRTKYQHVTGTRCPTDFAEVPSLLMEYFATSEKVVSSFARHYKTGESMPASMLKRVCHAKQLFAASDMQLQIFYSVLDQRYHGDAPLSRSSTDTLADIQNRYYGIPYVDGTAWQSRFNHLVAYGAKYYAYLMARAVATRIWHKCFSHDPFNREMGERYRREMLQHGGGPPPHELIQGMLGERYSVDGLVASLVDDISR